MVEQVYILLLVGSLFVGINNMDAAPTELKIHTRSLFEEGCPSNKPEQHCEVDPCNLTPYGYCPLHPAAVCKAYKCGMCVARWYNELNEHVFCYAF